MKEILLILAIFVLSGCQTTGGSKVARCKGPIFYLNPEHWQPDEAGVKTHPQTIQGR